MIRCGVAGKTPEVVGQYLVYEQIGRGGMATVHRAETKGIEGFRKAVALKRLLPHLAADAELVQAFTHEALLASHLRHANCAQTYDLGKVDDIYFNATVRRNPSTPCISARCTVAMPPRPSCS